LPEICQNLRYAQPRIAPRLDLDSASHLRGCVGREVPDGVVNHPPIDGMQGSGISNPLSSTPGQRPSPPSTARETAPSRSGYAATATARPTPSSKAAVTRPTIAGVVSRETRGGAADDGWCADGCRVGPITVGLAPRRRREHPAAEHSEGPAWAYTAWLLADFLDFAADENGATATLTGSLFAKLLEEGAQ
jgi:hypothetical protein